MKFCQLKPRVENAMGDIDAAVSRSAAAKTQLAQVQATLAAMPTTYGSVITEVDDGATANNKDAAWQTLKAAKDLAVAERAEVLADVEAALLVFAKIESHGAAAVARKLEELT